MNFTLQCCCCGRRDKPRGWPKPAPGAEYNSPARTSESVDLATAGVALAELAPGVKVIFMPPCLFCMDNH